MHIRVRLFALQRQQLGRRELSVDLPIGTTIEGAWQALERDYPQLAPARRSMRFARNATYADPAESLEEGDELALIPPVAGGAGGGGRSTMPRSTRGGERPAPPPSARRGGRPELPRFTRADPRLRRLSLSESALDEAQLAAMREAIATTADGAVVTFLGRTRETPGTPAPGQETDAARFAGRRVEALLYEAYEEMALLVLEAIADEIDDRFGVRRLAIVHRTGEVPLEEASVAIAVAAPHRGPAFEACRYAIEELKARAPIWKSERFADGSVWIGAPPRAGPEGARVRSRPARDAADGTR